MGVNDGGDLAAFLATTTSDPLFYLHRYHAADGRWLEGRVDAERVALALASGEGAALVDAGVEVLDSEPLGRMESAEPTEPTGPEGEASRTRALSAAAVPPAARTATTVSAAIVPDLVTAPP